MRDRYVEHALRIARKICRDAHVDDDAAGWMAWQVHQTARGRTTEAYRAVGPNLYDGAAGIALFLARAHEAQADPLVHDFVHLTLAGVEASAHQLDGQHTGGLYTGTAGVRWALQQIEDPFATSATGALEAVDRVGDPNGDDGVDFLSGRAGQIVAMLSSGDVRSAEKLAEELMAASFQDGDGINWSTNFEQGNRPLAGLSHGTAGIALALAEAAVATARPDFADAAMAAVVGENQGFSTKLGNWLDFRGGDDAEEKGAAMTAWCHGAPGVGLARARIAALLGGHPTLEQDVGRAIEATIAALPADPRGSGHSLCHGLAGNLEFLLDVGRHRGDEELVELVEDYINELLDAADLGFPLVAGTRSGRQVPGLMLGLSGIGHFLLRLADPTVPSVLLPETRAS